MALGTKDKASTVGFDFNFAPEGMLPNA